MVVKALRIATLALLLLVVGCASDKADYHLILGFGVVKVAKLTNGVATVTQVKAAGVYTGTGSTKLNVGWIKQTQASVATNANLTLELK